MFKQGSVYYIYSPEINLVKSNDSNCKLISIINSYFLTKIFSFLKVTEIYSLFILYNYSFSPLNYLEQLSQLNFNFNRTNIKMMGDANQHC